MNAKALGSGALMLLGVGGFLAYDQISERRAARKRAAELEQDRQVEAEKQQEQAERVKAPVWATLPDLTGKTEREAKELLAAAGFQEIAMEVMAPRYECAYDVIVDEPSDMVAQGTICNQDPAGGGRLRAERLSIRVVIEHDTFEQGGLATGEWRRMPDVLGMSLAEAQTVLASKGFGPDEFAVEDYTHSCPRSKVCETVPAAGKRKPKATRGTIRASLK